MQLRNVHRNKVKPLPHVVNGLNALSLPSIVPYKKNVHRKYHKKRVSMKWIPKVFLPQPLVIEPESKDIAQIFLPEETLAAQLKDLKDHALICKF